MAIETTTYIDGLVATNPTATDPKSQGDDHLRLLKSTIKATFPNVVGAVTPTHIELNFVDGVTSPIQAQLDAEAATRLANDNTEIGLRTAADLLLAPLASPALTGTPTAPTPALGTNTDQLATTAFANQLAFAAALPAQPGGDPTYVLSTNGGIAFWGNGTPDYLLMAQGVI